MTGDDYRIISDTLKDGARHITAIPSRLVCSVQLDFDIIDNRIRNLAYRRGCEGNLTAIGRLLEGMRVDDAASMLDGVDCHGKGTSCSDQLARILKSLPEK